MEGLSYVVVDPIRAMLITVANFIPTLIAALLILVFGWIFAKIVQKIAHRILQAIKFENLSKKAGVADVLHKGGIELTASELISRLVYWFVMILVLVITVNILGLTVASQLLERLTAYVPRVISALFVLIFGMFLANVVSSIVTTTAVNTKIPRPDILSGVTKWAILIFATLISLGELGVAAIFVNTTFNIFFGAVCLALALAFGLGGKDVAAKILNNFYNEHSK